FFNMASTVIVGMDFGTTNSGMAVYDGKQLQLVPLDPANRNPHVARTALYITNDRSIHIGRDATNTYYEQNLNRPSKMEMVHVGEIELTFAELPTFVRDVYIEKDIYSPGRLFLSFKMGLSSQNYLGTIVGLQYFFLEDIIATYLYVTRMRAQRFLNRKLDTIVLGRPVRFSDDPEQNIFAQERLLRAAFLAGYKKVYFQYEPIAAAYFYEMQIDREQNILIFDFGGGTLDLSVLRVGNPKTRRVLANGGIPIAGDIFDQRIVRAKYPPHFGEGSTYQSMNTRLPVPPSFYEAFSDWQTLLTLQSLDSQEKLQQIAQTADHPHKLQALLKLISGQYGLRMYDIAESAKRQLSDTPTARLDLEGDGFKVFDTITRSEFERLIRADVRAISERLDDVLEQAELRESDIDVVIRTGGSARIPVFIDLLEERFGAGKVRDLDAFSSVTSGLGVIAHRIEQGEIDLPEYTVETYTGRNSLYPDAKTRVPAVDLQVVQRVIDVQETGGVARDDAGNMVPLGLDTDLKIMGMRIDDLDEETPLDAIGLGNAADAYLVALPADEDILLLTTDYRVHRRIAGELADLYAAGLRIESLEGFRADKFSTEYVYSLA
ncbi:MAG: Hsp70 family protein, partial [Anaerolineae bacterium]|nr:Hsp70 family protein [Anaerolineae bacterium]